MGLPQGWRGTWQLWPPPGFQVMQTMCACSSDAHVRGPRGADRARPCSGCPPGIWPLRLSSLSTSSHLSTLPSACCLSFPHSSLLPGLQASSPPYTSCSPWLGQMGKALGVNSFFPTHGKVWLWGRKEGHRTQCPVSRTSGPWFMGTPRRAFWLQGSPRVFVLGCPVSFSPAGSEDVESPPHHLISQGSVQKLGEGSAGEVAAGRTADTLSPLCSPCPWSWTMWSPGVIHT